MSLKSGFLHEGNRGTLQLYGSGLPYPKPGVPKETKWYKAHVRAHILPGKSGKSYVHVIADDIRKRYNQAQNGGWYGKMAINYYSQFGYDPFRVATDLQGKTGLMTSGAATEDVTTDAGLAEALSKLENALGVSVPRNGASSQAGSGSSGNGSSGNGSSGSGSGSGGNGNYTTGNGSSGGSSKIFGLSPTWLIGGAVGLGALIMVMKK